MAWGFWNKFKNGFKKGFTWIKNKIIRPLIKKAPDIMAQVGPMLATMPGKAGAVGKAMTVATPILQTLRGINKN